MRFEVPEEKVVRPNIEPASILGGAGIAKTRILGCDAERVSRRVGAAKGSENCFGGLEVLREGILKLAGCGGKNEQYGNEC